MDYSSFDINLAPPGLALLAPTMNQWFGYHNKFHLIIMLQILS